jgi:hypothetical protein
MDISPIFTDCGGICPRFRADEVINAIAHPSGVSRSTVSSPYEMQEKSIRGANIISLIFISILTFFCYKLSVIAFLSPWGNYNIAPN